MSDDPAFKIKTGNLPVLLLYIASVDVDLIKSQLNLRLSQTPDFFSNTPIVLELSAISELNEELNFPELLSFMRGVGMCAAGAIGGSELQRNAAVKSGLGLFPELLARNTQRKVLDQSLPEIESLESAAVVGNIQGELPGFAQEGQATEVSTRDTIIPALVINRPTLVVEKPVRTGQRIYAEGANLVVLDSVNAGAELIADGDIHVYASMRGKAIAGAQGNENARIFVNGLEAELLSIAGCFKVFENGIPEDVRGKPAHVHLDGSRLVIQPLFR